MRAAFGDALREAMGGRSNVAVGRHVGLTDDAVAKWIRGESEPPPLTVFAVEEFLGVPPGDLSRHLGFLPVAAKVSVLSAIDADERLTDRDRKVLRAAYRALHS